MQVETYEVEPIDQSEMQALAAEGETLELIESLELTGQQSLVNQETGTILPYRYITKQERFVFRTLFPQDCPIEAYKDGPIPLRVLQCAAHVKTLNREDMAFLQVWYPRQGIDDPVLVARKSSWSDPVYLIARWGKALLPFETLLAKAIKEQQAKVKQTLLDIKTLVDQKLANVQSYVEAKAADGELPTPSFHY